MKKFLPVSMRGFTLIELLVVVAIIAILSIIGIAIFTGVQKNARDARRTSDIDAIAHALETTYNSGTYQTVSNTNFSSGKIPLDPINDSTYQYSFATNTADSGGPGGTPATPITSSTPTTSVGIANAKYFIVCAKVENTSIGIGNSSTQHIITTAVSPAYYCRRSQQ